MKLCKRVFFTSFLCLLFPLSTFANTWLTTMGRSGIDEAKFVHVTSDGGSVVAGSSYDEDGNSQSLVVKMDKKGLPVWSHIFKDDNMLHNDISAFRKTSAKGFIMAVSAELLDNMDQNTLIIKLDDTGNVIWSKSYNDGREDFNSNMVNDILETSDGGFIAVGDTTMPKDSVLGCWVFKLNEKGDIIWQRKYFSKDGAPTANSIQKTSDGGFIVAGDMNEDYWILKLDKEGKTLWQKTYDSGNNIEEVYTIKETADKGFVLVGRTGMFDSDPSSNEMPFSRGSIIKLDSDGEIMWNSTYAGKDQVGISEAKDVQETPNHDFIVVGSLMGSQNSTSVMLKISGQDGKLLWKNPHVGSTLNAIKIISKCRYMTAGTVSSEQQELIYGTLPDSDVEPSIQLTDFLVLKVNPKGDTLLEMTPSIDAEIVYDDNAKLKISSSSNKIDFVDTKATIKDHTIKLQDPGDGLSFTQSSPSNHDSNTTSDKTN